MASHPHTTQVLLGRGTILYIRGCFSNPSGLHPQDATSIPTRYDNQTWPNVPQEEWSDVSQRREKNPLPPAENHWGECSATLGYRENQDVMGFCHAPK